MSRDQTGPPRATGQSTPTATGDGAALGAARTRTGTTYAFIVIGTLVAVALVAFIVQNLDRHPVNLFWLSWDLPLGINMLIAALASSLITGLVGAARITQLKRAYRKA